MRLFDQFRRAQEEDSDEDHDPPAPSSSARTTPARAVPCKRKGRLAVLDLTVSSDDEPEAPVAGRSGAQKASKAFDIKVRTKDPLRGKVKLEQLGEPKPVSTAHDASARSDPAGQGHSDAVESGFGDGPRSVGEPSGLAGGSWSQLNCQGGASGATTAAGGDPWRVASQVAPDDPEAADELWDAVPSQPRPRAKMPKAEKREGEGDAPEYSARARARPAHRQTDIQEMEERMGVQLEEQPAEAMEEQPVYDAGHERGGDAWGADGSFDDGLDVEEEPLVLGDLANQQVVVPGSVNRRLFPYQRNGVQFLFNLYSQGLGGILADDMGLGKTIQVIALVAALLGKTGRRVDDIRPPLSPYSERKILIVVPTSVLGNWKNEFERWVYFAPNALGLAHGDQFDNAMYRVEQGGTQVLLTSHGLVRNNEHRLAAIEWDAVIVDEAHVLKNDKSKLHEAMKMMRTTVGNRRFGLTGTPMPNEHKELWCLLNWAVPGCLGEKQDFREFYEMPIKLGQKSDASLSAIGLGARRLEILQEKRRLFVLRRTKEATVRERLTTKRDNIVFCKLSVYQERAYRRFVGSSDVQLVLQGKEECDCGSGDTRSNCCYRIGHGPMWTGQHLCECDDEKCKRHHGADGCNKCPSCLLLPSISVMAKICNHLELLKAQPADGESAAGRAKMAREVALVTEILGEDLEDLGGPQAWNDYVSLSDSKYCGKMKVLQILLDMWYGATQQKNKVLVFSYSTKTLDIIQKAIERVGYNFVRLDGGTSQAQRQPLVDKFNHEPNVFLFLISTKAGGLGLNLTAANKVVVFDPCWNPAQDLQAQDRAFRLGQQRHVAVYRLIALGTLEENIYERQVYKQQQSNMAMTGNYEKRFFTAVQGDATNHGELFGVKNMFELHAGVKTKEIIDNQEASCSQQQESLYRIVEYNTGEEIDEAGGAVAPAGPADEHDVAAAGLQHVAGILQEVLVGSQANPKPKLGRANGGGGGAADVEMAEEDHDGEDDGMLALTRPGTSEEEAGFQVAYEHEHDRLLGGSEAERRIRQMALVKAEEEERKRTEARGHGPVGPPQSTPGAAAAAANGWRLSPNKKPPKPPPMRKPPVPAPAPAAAAAAAAAATAAKRKKPSKVAVKEAKALCSEDAALEALAAWQGIDKLSMAEKLLMLTKEDRDELRRAFSIR